MPKKLGIFSLLKFILLPLEPKKVSNKHFVIINGKFSTKIAENFNGFR